jgi:uncharacterized protein
MKFHTRDKLAFLSGPDAYPGNRGDVSVIETHKSWVFLTAHHAYKMKKPIQYNAVDFRPMKARCDNCEKEIILNRRLGDDVYEGISRLVLTPEETLALDEDGELVECLVRMTRLPSDRMLSSLITTGELKHEEILAVAEKLAQFYGDSSGIDITPDSYRDHLLSEIQESYSALADPSLVSDQSRVEKLNEWQIDFVTARFPLLRDRVMDGKIKDGHGDLRTEHICVLDPPVMFDCLEFDDQLRMADPIDELSFLALECERLGDDSIAETLFDVYRNVIGDNVSPLLIYFYSVYRACMWARLAAWRARELPLTDRGRWITRIESYLQIAESYVERASQAEPQRQRASDGSDT